MNKINVNKCMSKFKKIDKYMSKVKKLACGRSTVIPGYGKITAYRKSNGVRKFSLSGSSEFPNGGNLSTTIIESDLFLI